MLVNTFLNFSENGRYEMLRLCRAEERGPDSGKDAHHSVNPFRHKRLVVSILFFFFFLWCAPFGYLYFQFFFNVIASKSLTSIQDTAGDSNPQPFGSESSALTTRPGFSPQLYFCLTQLLTLP